MFHLYRTTSEGTDVITFTPLDPHRPQVVIHEFTNGKRTGHKVYDYADWPDVEIALAREGFIGATGQPDMVAELDVTTGILTIAGSIPYTMDGDKPMTDQADELLDVDFSEYGRTSDWILVAPGKMVALIAPVAKSDNFPAAIVGSASDAIENAAGAVRGLFALESNRVGDWLTFIDMPDSTAFPRNVAKLRGRIIDSLVTTGGYKDMPVEALRQAIGAIQYLLIAFKAAEAGDANLCIAAADKAVNVIQHDRAEGIPFVPQPGGLTYDAALLLTGLKGQQK